MTREETKEHIKAMREQVNIMQAYVDGERVQVKRGDEWFDVEDPEWVLKHMFYRIKPKYRPFANAKECWQEMQKHQPFGWIKCKEGYFNIVYVDDYYVGLADKDNSSILLASKNSYQDNTFADGTPFGVKIEE